MNQSISSQLRKISHFICCTVYSINETALGISFLVYFYGKLQNMQFCIIYPK